MNCFIWVLLLLGCGGNCGNSWSTWNNGCCDDCGNNNWRGSNQRRCGCMMDRCDYMMERCGCNDGCGCDTMMRCSNDCGNSWNNNNWNDRNNNCDNNWNMRSGNCMRNENSNSILPPPIPRRMRDNDDCECND